MRTFLAVVLSALLLTSSLSGVAHAEETSTPDPTADLEAAGKRQRAEGAVLGAIGSVLLAGGVIMAIVARPVSGTEAGNMAQTGVRDAGIAMVPAGLLVGGIGVFLWNRGERKLSAAEKAKKASSAKVHVELAPAPAGSLGAGLGMRFQ
jgi:hypothetical protein